MSTQKHLPTVAEAAGKIVQEVLEREFGEYLGTTSDIVLAISVMYPETWVGEDPHNARDSFDKPCIVGVRIEDDLEPDEFTDEHVNH